ncbi:MAG: ABC transporter substrate-binding protein [Burkholderiales bacterium]
MLIALGAGVCAPALSFGQQPAKLPLVGYLHPGFPPPSPSNITEEFRQGLRDNGYIEGRNITVEYRWGRTQAETLPALAMELVKLKVDVLVATGPAALAAVKAAAGTIPILANDLESDPVASGLVASLARPGGNVTGLFLDFPAITGKWLELLTETVPGIRRAAVLWDSTSGLSQIPAITAEAKKRAMALDIVKFQQVTEIEAVLDGAMKKRPQALIQLSSPIVNFASDRVARFTQTHRLPAISMFTAFPDKGGLMSFGPNLPMLYRRLVPLVDKILKGTKPGDIPIERPTTFELVVNRTAAKALGVTVPATILVRADRIIE